MNRDDVLETIGDFLVQIDMARGSLLPNDPHRLELDSWRERLDERQRRIAQAVFQDNTVRFQSAAQNLKAINAEVAGSIRHVEDIVEVLDSIKRFLDAVNGVVAVVAPLL